MRLKLLFFRRDATKVRALLVMALARDRRGLSLVGQGEYAPPPLFHIRATREDED